MAISNQFSHQKVLERTSEALKQNRRKPLPFDERRDRASSSTPYAQNQVILSSGRETNGSLIKLRDVSKADNYNKYFVINSPSVRTAFNHLELLAQRKCPLLVILYDQCEAAARQSQTHLPNVPRSRVITADYKAYCKSQSELGTFSNGCTLSREVLHIILRNVKKYRLTVFRVFRFANSSPQSLLWLVEELDACYQKHKKPGPIVIQENAVGGRSFQLLAAHHLYAKRQGGDEPTDEDVFNLAALMPLQRDALRLSSEQYQQLLEYNRLLSLKPPALIASSFPSSISPNEKLSDKYLDEEAKRRILSLKREKSSSSCGYTFNQLFLNDASKVEGCWMSFPSPKRDPFVEFFYHPGQFLSTHTLSLPSLLQAFRQHHISMMVSLSKSHRSRKALQRELTRCSHKRTGIIARWTREESTLHGKSKKLTRYKIILKGDLEGKRPIHIFHGKIDQFDSSAMPFLDQLFKSIPEYSKGPIAIHSPLEEGKTQELLLGSYQMFCRFSMKKLLSNRELFALALQIRLQRPLGENQEEDLYSNLLPIRDSFLFSSQLKKSFSTPLSSPVPSDFRTPANLAPFVTSETIGKTPHLTHQEHWDIWDGVRAIHQDRLQLRQELRAISSHPLNLSYLTTAQTKNEDPYLTKPKIEAPIARLLSNVSEPKKKFAELREDFNLLSKKQKNLLARLMWRAEMKRKVNDKALCQETLNEIKSASSFYGTIKDYTKRFSLEEALKLPLLFEWAIYHAILVLYKKLPEAEKERVQQLLKENAIKENPQMAILFKEREGTEAYTTEVVTRLAEAMHQIKKESA